MKKSILAVLVFFAVPAFAQSVGVDWEWKGAHRCKNVSPALTVTGIPEGTKSLAVQMNDLDFQNKDHGGGTIPHGGGDSASIPEGALAAYLGPCPNNFASFGHSYQITVKALGADGTQLASGRQAKDFNSKTAKD